MDYWLECISEAADACGAELTAQQLGTIARMVEGAHENYGLATGQEVANRNWRATHDRDLEKRGAEKVLSYVERRMTTVDDGPSRAFDHMNRQQRLAMHELFQARDFLRREGVPVG